MRIVPGSLVPVLKESRSADILRAVKSGDRTRRVKDCEQLDDLGAPTIHDAVRTTNEFTNLRVFDLRYYAP